MSLNAELVEISRESAIFALANGAEIDLLIEGMEENAQNDMFAEAEGIRQGLYDWVACRDRLNSRTVPYRDGERLTIDFTSDEEDNEIEEDDFK